MHAHHILYVQQTSVTSGTDILKGFATCVMKAYIQSQCIHKVSNGLDIWEKEYAITPPLFLLTLPLF